MSSTSDIARKIVGDNSRLGRSKSDFYPTPKYVTELLLTKEQFSGNIWECACGKGDISNVLINAGYKVKSTDINDYGFGETGIDFLNTEGLFADSFEIQDNVVTNPPFNLAVKFIKQAKMYSRYKVAMFLKTSFLEGVERYDLFQDKQFPLKCMYQFSRRVGFGKNEGTYKNDGMIAFAWFVWEREYKGKPIIEWII